MNYRNQADNFSIGGYTIIDGDFSPGRPDIIGGFSFKKLGKGFVKVVAAPVKAAGKVVALPGKAVGKVLPKPLKPVGKLIELPGSVLSASGKIISDPKRAKDEMSALARHVGQVAGSPAVKIVSAGSLAFIGIPPHVTVGVLSAAQRLDAKAVARNSAALKTIEGTQVEAALGRPEAVAGLRALNEARRLRGQPPLKAMPLAEAKAIRTSLKKTLQFTADAKKLAASLKARGGVKLAVKKPPPKPTAKPVARPQVTYARGVPVKRPVINIKATPVRTLQAPAPVNLESMTPRQLKALIASSPSAAIREKAKAALPRAIQRMMANVRFEKASGTKTGFFVTADGRVKKRRKWKRTAKGAPGWLAAAGVVTKGTFEAA